MGSHQLFIYIFPVGPRHDSTIFFNSSFRCLPGGIGLDSFCSGSGSWSATRHLHHANGSMGSVLTTVKEVYPMRFSDLQRSSSDQLSLSIGDRLVPTLSKRSSPSVATPVPL